MLTPRGSSRDRLVAATAASSLGLLTVGFTYAAVLVGDGVRNHAAFGWGAFAGVVVLTWLTTRLTGLWRSPGIGFWKRVRSGTVVAVLAWFAGVTVHDLYIRYALTRSGIPGPGEHLEVLSGVVTAPGWFGLLCVVPVLGTCLGATLWLWLAPAHGPGDSAWDRVRAMPDAEREPLGEVKPEGERSEGRRCEDPRRED